MSNDNLPSKNTKNVLHGEFIGKDDDSNVNDSEAKSCFENLNKIKDDWLKYFHQQQMNHYIHPNYYNIPYYHHPLGGLFNDPLNLIQNFINPFKR